MRILVTGAAGFLGARIAVDLRERGHDVVATDRRGDAVLVGDLSDPAFTSALPDVDAVLHSAGVQYVSPDLPLIRRARWFQQNNVVATRNLVDRYKRGGAHFVYVSTSMTYAQGTGACGPSTPREAQGTYSASKLLAEAYVTSHAPSHATIVPCIIAGDGRGGLFVPFVRSMRKWGTALVPGRGRNKVSMVHVADVSALAVQVLEQRASGLFNAAGPDAVSLHDWVDEIQQALELPPVRRLTVPYGLLHKLSVCVGYRLLAREQLLMLTRDHVLDTQSSMAIGWTPRWSNREIVRDTAVALSRQP